MFSKHFDAINSTRLFSPLLGFFAVYVKFLCCIMKRIGLNVKSYTYGSDRNSKLPERSKSSKKEAQSRKWRENS